MVIAVSNRRVSNLATEFEAHCDVPSMAGVYILGCPAKRVTFVAQQHRAFSLIWSLSRTGKLKVGRSLAIVGGGLTAAAAAHARGVKVVLYEKEATLTHLQHGVTHRYIHPHYSDWPNERFSDPQAKLPLLDWKAGPCHEVMATIATERRIRFEVHGRVEVRLRSEVSRLDRDGQGPPVIVIDPVRGRGPAKGNQSSTRSSGEPDSSRLCWRYCPFCPSRRHMAGPC